MRIWLSGPRMLGGLVRPGVSFRPAEVRAIAAVSFQPSWFDRLLLRAIALGFLIAGALAIFAVGAFVWALFSH